MSHAVKTLRRACPSKPLDGRGWGRWVAALVAAALFLRRSQRPARCPADGPTYPALPMPRPRTIRPRSVALVGDSNPARGPDDDPSVTPFCRGLA